MVAILNDRPIAFKLSFYILTVVILILIFLFSYNYYVSQKLLIKNVEENANNLTIATANKIDQIFFSTGKVADSLRVVLQNTDLREAELLKLHKAFLESNPRVFGTCIAFEPGILPDKPKGFAPYFYRENGEVKYKDLFSSYDYFDWEWYAEPKKQSRPVWTEPYFDEGGGNILMTTYSVPFFRLIDGKRKLAGIVTIDISLAWLQEIISSIRFFDSGYGFIISRKGTFVTHPEVSLIMKSNIFAVAEKLEDRQLTAVAKKMVDGDNGFARHTSLSSKKPGWLYYCPLQSTKWSLAVFFPNDELVADLKKTTQTMIFFIIPGVLILLLTVVLVSNRIIAPLGKLTKAVALIGKGDLDVNLPEAVSDDEIGHLTKSFGIMQQDLIRYIADLKETTSAKEKIESELRVAHDIQMSIIPNIFPPFPDNPEFGIFALLQPAKEVGGDLYDFFFIDEKHLCFAIGDVSGKGVPASLFMAVTRTLLRTQSANCLDSSKIMTSMNKVLSADNEASMFVTFFLVIMDITTGEMTCSNAGHNPPYIVRTGGAVESVEQSPGMPLGIMADLPYESSKIKLKPGDMIVLYTDGVTEATDVDFSMFGEEKLIEVIKHVGNPQEITENIFQAVKKFAEDAEQADDITILALKYNG